MFPFYLRVIVFMIVDFNGFCECDKVVGSESQNLFDDEYVFININEVHALDNIYTIRRF